MTDETKGDGMTLEQVLAEWVFAGGSHHGPKVETVTMPLSDYVRFRNEKLAEERFSFDYKKAYHDALEDLYLSRNGLAAQSAIRVDEALIELMGRVEKIDKQELVNTHPHPLGIRMVKQIPESQWITLRTLARRVLKGASHG